MTDFDKFCDYLVDNYENADGIVDDDEFMNFMNCFILPYSEKNNIALSDKLKKFMGTLGSFITPRDTDNEESEGDEDVTE